MNMKDIIIDKLKENTSLTIMEINDLLGLTSIEEYQSLENALDSLVSDGILYYSEKKKKYLLLENSHLVKGNLILNDKGFGFVNIGNFKPCRVKLVARSHNAYNRYSFSFRLNRQKKLRRHVIHRVYYKIKFTKRNIALRGYKLRLFNYIAIGVNFL